MYNNNEESKLSRSLVESAAVSNQPEALGCHLYHISMVDLRKQLTNAEEYGIPSIFLLRTRND